VHAREAVGEQAALEVAAQLALDEARQAVAVFESSGAFEEGLDGPRVRKLGLRGWASTAPAINPSPRRRTHSNGTASPSRGEPCGTRELRITVIVLIEICERR
jgi:hypothetical protein